jgi:hypothetical protein
MEQIEKLILFLVNADPGIKGIYALVRLFDRVNFPGKIGESIDKLMEKNFIVVTNLFDNGTPAEYDTTKEGKEYLKTEFKGDEILEYIKIFDNSEILYLLTKGYIDQANTLQ